MQNMIQVGPTGDALYEKNYGRIFKKPEKVYLAGAIEFAPDGGQKWRKQFTPILKKIGYEVINPYLVEREYNGKAVIKGDLSLYRQWVREKVIEPDLRKIDSCNLIIVNWDEYAKNSGGTNGELMYALVNDIPVYLVESIPREEISGWMLGCTTKTFNTFKELEEHLVNGTK